MFYFYHGFFTRAFCLDTLNEHGINFTPLQANHAGSTQAGTLRGLHYQDSENAEAKLFRCISGKLFDVIVDLRKNSSTYLQWFGIELIPGLDIPSVRELFYEFHEIFGLLILFILIFHIIGALKHTFIDKDGTLRRMWFK